MILRIGDTISVPKDGVIEHVGIYVGDVGGGTDEVVHNTPRAGGVIRESLRDCAGSHVVKIRERAPLGSEVLLAERALSAVGSVYDLITFNCEHFVTWVRSGQPKSGQLRNGLAAAAVAVFGIFLATRPSYDRSAGRYRNRAGQFTTWI